MRCVRTLFHEETALLSVRKIPFPELTPYMPQTNTELAESLHQFVTIWNLIGRPFPQVDQTDRAGLAITWPDTHFPFYNALFLTEQLTDAQALEGRVQEAAAYMRARPNGGLFVVCLDNLNGAAKDPGSGKVCAGYTDDWHGGRYPPDGSTGPPGASIRTDLERLNDTGFCRTQLCFLRCAGRGEPLPGERAYALAPARIWICRVRWQ